MYQCANGKPTGCFKRIALCVAGDHTPHTMIDHIQVKLKCIDARMCQDARQILERIHPSVPRESAKAVGVGGGCHKC